MSPMINVLWPKKKVKAHCTFQGGQRTCEFPN